MYPDFRVTEKEKRKRQKNVEDTIETNGSFFDRIPLDKFFNRLAISLNEWPRETRERRTGVRERNYIKRGKRNATARDRGGERGAEKRERERERG